MTYEIANGILFSSDAFGSFGALSGNLFADEVDYEDGFLPEARRYYANIVGRFGATSSAGIEESYTSGLEDDLSSAWTHLEGKFRVYSKVL